MLTKSEFERFLDDPVWKVFQKELHEMRGDVIASILNENEPMEIYRAQGRCEVLADIAKWPEMQLEELKTD